MLTPLVRFFFPSLVSSSGETPAALDSTFAFWRIRVFLAAHLGYCIFYLTRKNLTPALHIFSEKLGIDIFSLGIITGVFSITYGVGKIISGFLADRISSRLLMASGLLCSGIINLFFGFFSSLWVLVFFWGLNGFCQSAGYPPIAKTLVSWFAPSERAKIWSWWNSSHIMGTFLAGSVVALLLKYSSDWRTVFYVPGIVSIIAAILIFLSLRNSPESIGLPPIEVYKKETSFHAASHMQGNQWYIIKKYILSNQYVWYLCTVLCLLQMVRFSTLDWATKFLYEARGVGTLQVVWMWNFSLLLGLPGGISGGYMVSRFFRGRCCAVILGYLAALAASVYGYIVFAGANHVYLTGLFLGGLTFLIDGAIVLADVLLLRLTVREAAGTVAGISGGLSYILGTALGANFLAVYLVKVSGWDTLYYTCIGCVIVSIMFIMLCVRKEYSDFL